MREIESREITEAVAKLCEEANFVLGEDVVAALKRARDTEESELGREALTIILKNAEVAIKEQRPLCQDCGTAVVFVEVGQDLHITCGDFNEAIQEGVRRGYVKGYLRKSQVERPISTRANTGDNTPAIVHTEIVPGDRLKITCMPKGGGAENMSRLVMLRPGDGKQSVVDAVVGAVEQAGGSPCPPVIVGVGIAATAEQAMLLAKKSLLRPVDDHNPDREVGELEREILSRINDLGIGPQGLGGRVTALAVHADVRPTHMASLPVAIALQCHSARHRQAVL